MMSIYCKRVEKASSIQSRKLKVVMKEEKVRVLKKKRKVPSFISSGQFREHLFLFQ